jgi:hypothetical protein
VFVRGKYWYDFELKDESRRSRTSATTTARKAPSLPAARSSMPSFIHNYSIADQPGSVRLGKQVVSWGESTFIGGGINSINPIDVSAFRRPGAEIKEGLIPVNMFYVSQSLTENLSAEGSTRWNGTRPSSTTAARSSLSRTSLPMAATTTCVC